MLVSNFAGRARRELISQNPALRPSLCQMSNEEIFQFLRQDVHGKVVVSRDELVDLIKKSGSTKTFFKLYDELFKEKNGKLTPA